MVLTNVFYFLGQICMIFFFPSERKVEGKTLQSKVRKAQSPQYVTPCCSKVQSSGKNSSSCNIWSARCWQRRCSWQHHMLNTQMRYLSDCIYCLLKNTLSILSLWILTSCFWPLAVSLQQILAFVRTASHFMFLLIISAKCWFSVIKHLL